MKKAETQVGLMLLNYCEAISQSKTKSLSRAGLKWKKQIGQRFADAYGKIEEK